MLVLALLAVLNKLKTESLRDKLLFGSGGRWLPIGTILLGNPFPVALEALATHAKTYRSSLVALEYPFIDVDVMRKVLEVLDLPME